jgi:hypothetical protein
VANDCGVFFFPAVWMEIKNSSPRKLTLMINQKIQHIYTHTCIYIYMYMYMYIYIYMYMYMYIYICICIWICICICICIWYMIYDIYIYINLCLRVFWWDVADIIIFSGVISLSCKWSKTHYTNMLQTKDSKHDILRN